MPKATKLRKLKPLFGALRVVDRLQPPRGFVTYAGRNDGIGSQMHALLSIRAFAHLRRIRYLPRPLSEVAHNQDGDPDWDAKWNHFFGLGDAGPDAEGEMVDCRPEQIIRPRDGRIYRLFKAHSVVDLFPSSYPSIMPEFRQCYERSQVAKTHLFDPGPGPKVAIHLRLGDACDHPARVSDLRRALKIVQTIRRREPESQVLIFSQGEPSCFRELVDAGASLRLNAGLFETFHSLVVADQLVMAKSSLSYVAALYNPNQVIYESFWHPRLPAWCDSESLFPLSS